MNRTFLTTGLVLMAGLILSIGTADARPAIRLSFLNAYPVAVNTRLENLPTKPGHCGVCHLDFNGGGTRNFYGVRLGQVIGNFSNNDAGRQQAMHSIENEDPDSDGFSTLTEVTSMGTYTNIPTFPGLNNTNVNTISNVNLVEVTPYVVPTTGVDTTPPNVTVTSPNGAESWTAITLHNITWTATDNVSVTQVDIFYRDSESHPWTQIARNLTNSGSFSWSVHNTPATACRVQVVARDAAGNSGSDMSNATFMIPAHVGGRVPTTLRDFHQPGTQPFQGGFFETSTNCGSCHGGYDTNVEPLHNWKGSMMGQAARDPFFEACMTVAEQDAPGSGDLCIRCHSPFAWLQGRSNPTNGSAITLADRDAVSCDICHRAVDPIYKPGISPVEDLAVINALAPADRPTSNSNGQFVIDPNSRKRGPFNDPVAPHAFLSSPFHVSSDMCGTCHDVSNPVFVRVSGPDYAPGPLDSEPGFISSDVHLPVERTFSEWKNSAFAAGGVYEPEFAGSKPDGIVASCQDCHLSDKVGKGCNDPAAPVRSNLPFHDMMGGNYWIPTTLSGLYPGETDPAALSAGAARAVAMLQKSAVLGVEVEQAGDSIWAEVTVTNRTGHKLPTGYPEGRRMFLNVVGYDQSGAKVFESGAYNAATGVLTHDPNSRIYETELGFSAAFAAALGLPVGPSFHFVLNDTVYKDNRIPPAGFTNSAFATFGGQPVDPEHPGIRYPDGQNWDEASYPLPLTTRKVVVRLYYQTTSKEYVEFLKNENTTNSKGLDLYNLWVASGRAAPVLMEADSVLFAPTGVAENIGADRLALTPVANPFRGELALRLDLVNPGPVALEIFDVQGRLVLSRDYGILGGGAHRLTWDGRLNSGGSATPGIYWARVGTGRQILVQKVVRLP